MFWVYRPSKLYNKQYTALYNVAMECWSIGGKIINWHYKVCINKEEGATGLSSSKSLATGKSDTYTVQYSIHILMHINNVAVMKCRNTSLCAWALAMYFVSQYYTDAFSHPYTLSTAYCARWLDSHIVSTSSLSGSIRLLLN